MKENEFNFRSGLRYCLRKQTNYENTFKVNNSRESDSSWVPYLAYMLGIDLETVRRKFNINKRVEVLKNAIKEVSNLPSESSQSLEAEITQIEASTARMKQELDKFDFKRSDENVSKELIEEVSSNVTEMVNKLYTLDQKIKAIDKSLKTEFSFDLEKVVSLFEEVEIYFPKELKKSYDELIELNTVMSTGRKKRLITTRIKIITEKETVNIELDQQREKQQKLTSILLQKDAFQKYKELQNRLTSEESRVAVLKEKLNTIDIAADLNRKLEKSEAEKTKAGKELSQKTTVFGNETLKQAVQIFSELVDDILNISAFFYVETNKDNNIQFKIGLKDQTSINEGFSYTRVLSAIFDATLLSLNKDRDYYKFCYHDGLLESLDDRLKLKLIEQWRLVSAKNKLQFIITVLDSDLPIKDNKKEYFSNQEVIRELHDRGQDGRLFKMPAF
jgi:uncharacterized protein YydD (DUF2326 family)